MKDQIADIILKNGDSYSFQDRQNPDRTTEFNFLKREILDRGKNAFTSRGVMYHVHLRPELEGVYRAVITVSTVII